MIDITQETSLLASCHNLSPKQDLRQLLAEIEYTVTLIFSKSMLEKLQDQVKSAIIIIKLNINQLLDDFTY